MGQTYVEGTQVPVTYVKAGPCVVTQIKNKDKDGYWAVQLGFDQKRTKNASKPLQGHLRGLIKDNKLPRFLREVKVKSEPKYKVGDILEMNDVLKRGDLVSVVGISKGKGFAGGVKRWGFAGGPKTHGQSDRQRAPGSIGQGTTPGRVLKGKHMAGRMGNDQVTVKNLIIVELDKETGEVAVSGAIPGRNGSLVTINKIGSGKLDELVQEVPQAQIVEGEESEQEATSEGQKKEEPTEVSTNSQTE